MVLHSQYLFLLVRTVSVQERHDLRAGASAARRKGRIAYAFGHTVGDCPAHRFGVILCAFHIGKQLALR